MERGTNDGLLTPSPFWFTALRSCRFVGVGGCVCGGGGGAWVVWVTWVMLLMMGWPCMVVVETAFAHSGLS